ncbi:DNA-3-methyladenine glycosylase [Oleiharenicola lentus]|uniref:DNA-3-methyladenine glycosylase n=1 Tax=Oleiharenicola lentus TaxID=2508720 RepID=UPI003F6752FD
MPRVIKAEELATENTVTLARQLLGKVLVRTLAGERTEVIITEVEAYHTAEDLACHASKGRTPRTDVMFRPGGIWYVYLCYGIHEMLNLVTGPADHPAAILIRGVDGAIGPGRVTKKLKINRTLNGLPAAPGSGLHLEDHGIVVPKRLVTAGPRVGIDYSGPIWSAKPWRFQFNVADLAKPARRRIISSAVDIH